MAVAYKSNQLECTEPFRCYHQTKCITAMLKHVTQATEIEFTCTADFDIIDFVNLRKEQKMLSTFRKKSPTYKAITIQGCRNKGGDYLWTNLDDLDEFAKSINMDWTWDAEHGEVKFWIPGFSGHGRPKFSVMIGYVAVSDGTCQHLEIWDKEQFRENFEKVEL